MQDQSNENRQVCAGMYSRKAWGGSVDPYILIKWTADTAAQSDPDPVVSMVIFEWRDYDLIGVLPTKDSFQVDTSQSIPNNRAKAFFRKNSSATPRMFRMDIVQTPKSENSSWPRTQLASRTILYSQKLFISRIPESPYNTRSQRQGTIVLERLVILLKGCYTRPLRSSGMLMESFQLPKSRSFPFTEGLRSSMLSLERT